MGFTAQVLSTVRVAVVLSVAAGCASPESTYFASGDRTAVSVPTDVATTAYFGIELLTAHPGDVVQLHAVAPQGLRGNASVDGIASVLGAERSWIGAATEAEVIDGGIDLHAYRSVAGVVFAEHDGPVALAVRVAGKEPVVGFDALTLEFTVNGGQRLLQTFPVKVRFCRAQTLAEASGLCHRELE
ncbi:MAG TPA: hypothetical protein VKB00_00375 [Candidatus Limnocylindrales bacterium]|nr:hypothetical protein [Candidatus Limnocylindrales bacterium]